MNRRSFTKTCIGCLGSAMVPSILIGCQSTYYTNGTMESNGISVLKSEFNNTGNGQAGTRSYVIVRNDALAFPIYLYKISDTEYSAVLMKCTHQGNELQASGDHLHCSAHGSEFNSGGKVVQGPAENDLRKFPVTSQPDKLFIDLRS